MKIIAMSYNKKADLYWLIIKEKGDKEKSHEALPFKDFEEFRRLVSYLHKHLGLGIYNDKNEPVPMPDSGKVN